MSIGSEAAFAEGDLVSRSAAIEAHAAARGRGWPELLDPTVLNYQVAKRAIVITEPDTLGRTPRDPEPLAGGAGLASCHERLPACCRR